jgi:hypothetical protein
MRILIRCKHSQGAARSFVRGLENRLKPLRRREPLSSLSSLPSNKRILYKQVSRRLVDLPQVDLERNAAWTKSCSRFVRGRLVASLDDWLSPAQLVELTCDQAYEPDTQVMVEPTGWATWEFPRKFCVSTKWAIQDGGRKSKGRRVTIENKLENYWTILWFIFLIFRTLTKLLIFFLTLARECLNSLCFWS